LLEHYLALLAPTFVEQNSRIEITAVRSYVREHYSAKQWACIDELWQRESSWRTKKRPWLAENCSSGAYGIVQALPARKMSSHGHDYRNNPYTQVKWGMDYISNLYGTPCEALRFHNKRNWY